MSTRGNCIRRIILIAGLFGVLAISCVQATSAAQPARMLFITSIGGLGDKSFNDDGYAGMVKAKRELGIEFDLIEPQQPAECEPYLEAAARSKKYDLIVALGYVQATPMKKVASNYPDQKFLLVDVSVDSPSNIRSVVFRKEEEGFILGVLNALMTTKTEVPRINPQKIIGAILAVDVPTTKNVIIGYQAGARYIDPSIKVLYSVIGDWNDQAKAKELAMAQYDMGADIIQHNAGNASLGIFEAARERNLYATGLNMDQTEIDPKHIFASGVRGTGEAIFLEIQKFLRDRQFKGGVVSYGFKEGTARLVFSGAVRIPEDVLAKVKDIEGKLRSGELVPPAFPDQVEPFFAKYGTYKGK